jgi:hypothetical protein
VARELFTRVHGQRRDLFLDVGAPPTVLDLLVDVRVIFEGFGSDDDLRGMY